MILTDSGCSNVINILYPLTTVYCCQRWADFLLSPKTNRIISRPTILILEQECIPPIGYVPTAAVVAGRGGGGILVNFVFLRKTNKQKKAPKHQH